MQKPLVIVLAAQMVVLVAAVGFLATRPSSSAPAHHAKERPEPAPEEVLHAPLVKLEKPAPAPTPADGGGGEWAEFPAGPQKAPGSEVKKAAPSAKEEEPPPPAFDALVAELVEGNARFVDGTTRQRDAVARRESLGGRERATAVVVTCTDSRVVPELMFDQPLGTFAVVRLPGAQLDDLGVRAVEDSVSRLHARAVLVLGHVGCHHVQHALEEAGKKTVARPTTLSSALSGLAGPLEGEALDEAATTASVSFAARELRHRSKALAHATDVTTLRVVYAPKTGKVRWLDAEQETEPAPAPRSGRR